MTGRIEADEAPELILHGGRISTPRRTEAGVEWSTCSAMAVRGERVARLGDDAEILDAAGPQTRTIDLAGARVLPGLIESHMHVVLFGLSLLGCSCRPADTDSVEEIREAVAAEAAQRGSGEWIRGWGWDESRMVDGRAPTRADLDAAAPDHPVVLRRTCAHMAVVNSAALRACGVDRDTPDPEGGRLLRDEDGELTGLLQERAMDLVKPPEPTRADIAEAVAAAQEALLARGITTAHDMAAEGEHLREFSRLRRAGRLKVRLRPWLWAIDGHGFSGSLDGARQVGLTAGFGDEMLRVQGSKFMLDGSVGGRTAAVDEPYEGTQERGFLTSEPGEIVDAVVGAAEDGLRAAVHGIGDRAVDAAVEVLVEVCRRVPGAERMRHRIEHCGLPSQRHLELMAEHGIMAGSSVGFLHELGDRYREVLGPERVGRAYPQRSFEDAGIVAPPNSDAPITDPNPWHTISAAVTRTSASGQVLDDGSERMELEAALGGMTCDAAYASFEEDVLGSLDVGSWADFVVCAQDPFAVSVEELAGLTVERTFVAGECMYDRDATP
ncbi:amidohydrolase [Nesterenkonia marinintestina]|uniref:amidohydrolase n=1 Tax=Nesterenkonia marinintestina TaxID=2979865 RepID=UPI0021BF8E26|nr:amidohydrolase [Nesterenkonia sp. GX14115]